MDSTLIQAILLGILSAIGLFLVVTSFAVPLQSATKKILEEESGPRLVGIAEGNIIRAMMVDLSKRLKPETGNLEERLRKSGWFYKSIADFHARRMVAALVYMILSIVMAVGIGVALGVSLGPLGAAIFATGGAILGFNMPNRALNSAIEKRRERLLREMGFGLDRISLFLQSDAPLMEALSQTANMGIFGKACAQIASQASTGRPISEIIRVVREDLPKTPQFDEFVEMVRIGMQKGQEMQEPFRQRAAAMRQRLRLSIIEAGNSAKIKVTLLTSGFILVASLIVTIVPVLVLLSQEGLF